MSTKFSSGTATQTTPKVCHKSPPPIPPPVNFWDFNLTANFGWYFPSIEHPWGASDNIRLYTQKPETRHLGDSIRYRTSYKVIIELVYHESPPSFHLFCDLFRDIYPLLIGHRILDPATAHHPFNSGFHAWFSPSGDIALHCNIWS